MQTIKPRARWLKGGTGQMWELSHPDSLWRLWSALPHDGALYMLRETVLPNQIRKRDWCETMERPKSRCGCPDCGSSLIDLGPGLRNTKEAA
ncbi:hypothetical protein KDX10_32970 [Burkholderia cenocepacia]|uniref:hypothetical protein n=1 Tax=Burkholderia cenocepacia TaxID=95486 RepID=UPI001B8F2BED|nr:hypothetical protein [Burkholderia cenocepacia]MBR8114457.1 hypothetical protein [Burkholderia cenocepacia]